MFRVFAEELGLDEDLALSVSQAFGGGMGHTGGACGAVTGAFMVLGLANKANRENPRVVMEKVNALQAEFCRKFKGLHGSLDCTGLLGYDMTDPEQAKEAREKGVIAAKCPVFVGDAAAIVEELLKK